MEMLYRIKRCATQTEFKQSICDLITAGYKLESCCCNSALLIKRKKKNHIRIAKLTLWWTFGLGNLIYVLIPAKTEDEIMIKLEELP